MRTSATATLSVRDWPRAIRFYKDAFGATEVVPVADAHGWRLGRIVDPLGHHWEAGRPLR